MEQGEVAKWQLRLDALIYGVNNDDDENTGSGSGGGGCGGDNDVTPGPGPPPPKSPQHKMEDIVRRLDIFKEIPLMFLQHKILELLLDKMKKGLKIGKLEK